MRETPLIHFLGGSMKQLSLMAIFAFVLCASVSAASPLVSVVLAEASLYLGEETVLTMHPGHDLKAGEIEWTVEREQLDALDAGELIGLKSSFNEAGQWEIRINAPYISPSFADVEVQVVGRKLGESEVVAMARVSLSVRAELVIKMKQTPNDYDFASAPDQVVSDFLWDVPKNPATGEYQTITVNNHPRGIWVRFLFENAENVPLIRSGGFLVHIYRGEGEYIKHQPFEKETHLMQSGCDFEPISDEEWRNPELGLEAADKPWSKCEFRGYVPAGMAYGFGYREHYLEDRNHQKFVEIKNVGELNTELIEYYNTLDAMGISALGAMCSTWED